MTTPTVYSPKSAVLRRVRLAAALAVTGVLAATMPTAPIASGAPAQSTSLEDLQKKRDEIRSQKAQKASEVDALQASDAEIKAALTDLNANIAGMATLLEEAKREVSAAEQQEQAALDAEVAAQKELDNLRGAMKQQAINQFTSSHQDETLSLISANEISEATTRKTFFDIRFQRDADTVQRFRTVQNDLAEATSTRTAARERAEAKRRNVDERLKKLSAAQDQQEKFQAQVDDRLDRSLIEANSLATTDAALSQEITQRQAEIAAEIERQRKLKAEADARAAAAGAAARASQPSASEIPIPSGGEGIVSVRGIRVASSIAGQIEALLAAAQADGIIFSGGGYRDPADQIAVRKANGCPDIYNAPASSCHPPTARPGRSMHERGLAIDFIQNGSTISRSSSGFAWLKANAARFGMYNLPSEAWHWSTNGN